MHSKRDLVFGHKEHFLLVGFPLLMGMFSWGKNVLQKVHLNVKCESYFYSWLADDPEKHVKHVLVGREWQWKWTETDLCHLYGAPLQVAESSQPENPPDLLGAPSDPKMQEIHCASCREETGEVTYHIQGGDLVRRPGKSVSLSAALVRWHDDLTYLIPRPSGFQAKSLYCPEVILLVKSCRHIIFWPAFCFGVLQMFWKNCSNLMTADVGIVGSFLLTATATNISAKTKMFQTA